MSGSPLDTKDGIVGVTTNTMSSEPVITLKLAFADAMWTWAEVETQVFAIYICTIANLTTDIRPIRSAFFAVNSFEMRLTMTDAAIKERWSRAKSLLKDWSMLQARCKTAARQRGRVAHRSAHVWWPEKPHQKPLVVLHEPPLHHASPQKHGIAKSIGIDEKMLRQFQIDWHQINSDLNQFALRVSHETQPPASGGSHGG